jgi:excisionase family DNA binding protein
MIKFSLQEKERYYAPREIAEHFEVSQATVTNWLNQGKLQGFRAGGRWKIREDDVFRFVQESTSIRKR